jgi:hypothetical protein
MLVANDLFPAVHTHDMLYFYIISTCDCKFLKYVLEHFKEYVIDRSEDSIKLSFPDLSVSRQLLQPLTVMLIGSFRHPINRAISQMLQALSLRPYYPDLSKDVPPLDFALTINRMEECEIFNDAVAKIKKDWSLLAFSDIYNISKKYFMEDTLSCYVNYFATLHELFNIDELDLAQGACKIENKNIKALFVRMEDVHTNMPIIASFWERDIAQIPRENTAESRGLNLFQEQNLQKLQHDLSSMTKEYYQQKIADHALMKMLHYTV